MSERKRLEKHEERLDIYYRDNGVCRFCGFHVSIHEFQVSHIIANTKWARKKYGDEVIDHSMNKACTHSGKCNDLIQITNNPVEREMLVDAIRKEIAKN